MRKSLNISINIFIETSTIIENKTEAWSFRTFQYGMPTAVYCSSAYRDCQHMEILVIFTEHSRTPHVAILHGFPSFNIQFHWSEVNNLSVLFPPFKCFPSLAFKAISPRRDLHCVMKWQTSRLVFELPLIVWALALLRHFDHIYHCNMNKRQILTHHLYSVFFTARHNFDSVEALKLYSNHALFHHRPQSWKIKYTCSLSRFA